MIIEHGKLDIPNPLEEEKRPRQMHPNSLANMQPVGTGRRVNVPSICPKRKPRPEESSAVMKELKKVLGYTKKKTLASLMLTQADIDAAERLLLALNTEQLKKLVATQQSFYTPIGIYLATYAKKLLVDLKEGKTEGVDKLRTRQYKAVNASLEQVGGGSEGLKIEIVGADGVAAELQTLLQGARRTAPEEDEEEFIEAEEL